MRFKAATSSLALGIALLSAPASAQTAQDDKSSLHSGGFADIIVTAQKREENIQDVPLTISAVSSTQLERSGVSTLRDLQNLVPGFTFGGQGTSSAPAIRGVSSNLSQAGTENPNAIYIDGVYHTDRSLLSLDLPDVERIEVLKGPQGTLFGRNATGGAVQIFTRNPSFETTGSVNVRASFHTGDGPSHSSPHLDASGFISTPVIDDVMAISLSGAQSWTKGYLVNDLENSRDGRIEKTTLRGKILIQPSEDFRLVAGAYYIKMDNTGNLLGTPYKGMTAASGPLYTDAVIATQPWHTSYTPQSADAPAYNVADFKGYGFTLRGELDASVGTFTSMTGYNNTKTVNWNSVSAAYSPKCVEYFSCIDYHFIPSGKEWSQELNFASQDFGAFSFVGGLYYYHGEGHTIGIIQETQQVIPLPAAPPGLLVQDTLAKKNAYAAFGEMTIRPADALTVIVGLRYNHEKHNDTALPTDTSPTTVQRGGTFNSLTPRFTVKYDISDDLNFYATLSKGYKSGLTGLTNTGSTPPFAPVAPETIWAYEAGMKFAGARTSFNLSAFYYDYKNKQEQTFTGTSSIVQNTGPVRIYGIDVDASAMLTDELTARAALSWIPKAEYRNFPDASGQSVVQNGLGAYLPGRGYQVASCTTAITPGCVAIADNPATAFVEGATFSATGMRLIRAPKLTASFNISYDRELGNGDAIDANATLYYSSDILLDITGTIMQGDYATLNTQVGYTFDGGVRIGLFGRNLTNKAYRVSGLTSSAGFNSTYAPPREVGISIGYNF